MKIPILRPYQHDAGAAVEISFLDNGQNRLLIKKPTGTGKTVWFAALLKAFPRLRAWLEQFPQDQRKMLVVAHRDDLLTQAAEKIRIQNPGLMVSIEQGELYANRYSDVVIASIQTLSAVKFRRLHRLLRDHKFRIVIVDEAHHSAAPTYRTMLVHLGFLPPADASEREEVEAANHEDVEEMARALESWDLVAPKDRLLIGVTATPNRSDAIGLGCVFQSIAFNYALKQAIEDGWLVPIVPWVVETSVSLDKVKTTAGDFNQKQLAEAVNTEERNRLAVDAWRKYGNDQPTLAFTVDVAHAHNMAREFKAQGYEFAAIDGTMEKFLRRDIIADYKRGNLQGLTNCMLLTEGSDLPLTGCILNAKPTKSATLYEQIIGRGLRLHPDDPAGPARKSVPLAMLLKPECLVIDVVDIARRHSLQAAPVLYGLPPGLNANGKNLRDVERELEMLREKFPQFDVEAALAGERASLEQLRVKASTFDVWTVQPLGSVAAGLVMNWIKYAEDTFRLAYPWADGTETITVEKDLLGHYDVVASLRPHVEKGEAPKPTRQKTLASQITDVRGALQMAESFVLQERRSVMKLKDREAPWRSRSATPKQKALLARYNVPHNTKTITAGEASDLIDLLMQRRNAGR